MQRSASKIQELLGEDFLVVELLSSARTAQDAASSVGCKVEQIVKSLVFKGSVSFRPILILVSGVNTVNEAKLKAIIGEDIEFPKADFVLEHTGFAIGGIPPVGHLTKLDTYIDMDLMKYDVLWAAAGTPNAVFKLSPKALVDMTDGKIIEI